jgi:hypothetical protein
MTRNGKIARLPRTIRDELNHRLQDGEQGKNLVPWLNALPEAQAVLAREFGGRNISEQNLSEWKSGGYRDWQAQQDALAQTRELAADAKELTEATDGRLTDHLATVLAARYAAALLGWNGEVSDEFRGKLAALRCLCQDIVELRRGDHSGARINMEREKLERQREKTEEEVVEHFKSWAKTPEIREWMSKNWVSQEERERRIRQILGIAPEEADEETAETPDTASDQTGSNPIKPDQTNETHLQT